MYRNKMKYDHYVFKSKSNFLIFMINPRINYSTVFVQPEHNHNLAC